MNKQKKNQISRPKGKIIVGLVISGIVFGLIGYSVLLSMIPVNADYPVFGAPLNIFIKSIKMPDGSDTFASQSTKGSKSTSIGAPNPTYHVGYGNLVSVRLINEIKTVPNIGNRHNLNIDEFNVHTGDVGYFQTKSITFLADKKGSFEYYDSYNPQMRGIINVQ